MWNSANLLDQFSVKKNLLGTREGERERERERPDDQDEQQNVLSSTCLTSSPINQDPTLTSSWAYVRRMDLPTQKNKNLTTVPSRIEYKETTVLQRTEIDLFIEINFANACDMTIISPEA